jgi:hypothetical protein
LAFPGSLRAGLPVGAVERLIDFVTAAPESRARPSVALLRRRVILAIGRRARPSIRHERADHIDPS